MSSQCNENTANNVQKQSLTRGSVSNNHQRRFTNSRKSICNPVNVHEELLSKIAQNCSFRNISIKQIMLGTAILQHQRNREGEDLHLAIDLYSLLTYYEQCYKNREQMVDTMDRNSNRVSNSNYNSNARNSHNSFNNSNKRSMASNSNTRNSAIDTKKNTNDYSNYNNTISVNIYAKLTRNIATSIRESQISEQIKHKIKIIEYYLFFMCCQFQPKSITIVFPQGQPTTFSKYDSNLVQSMIAKLLQVKWHQEKPYGQDLLQTNPNFCQWEYIFENLDIYLHNFACYSSTSQLRRQKVNLQQDEIQRLVRKVSCPRLDYNQTNMFSRNPCGRQMDYFAQKGYLCLSWNQFMNTGSRISGLPLQGIFDIIQLQERIKKYSSIVNNTEDEIIKETTRQKLKNLQKQIDEKKSNMLEQKVIFYQRPKDASSLPEDQLSKTQQIVMLQLRQFSNKLSFSEMIRQQIRWGGYSISQWQLKKIIVIYLLWQLYPVHKTITHSNHFSKSVVQNFIGFDSCFHAVFQAEFQGMTQQERFQHISLYDKQALFISRMFERHIFDFLPKNKTIIAKIRPQRKSQNKAYIYQTENKIKNTKYLQPKSTAICQASNNSMKSQIRNQSHRQQYQKRASRNLYLECFSKQQKQKDSRRQAEQRKYIQEQLEKIRGRSKKNRAKKKNWGQINRLQTLRQFKPLVSLRKTDNLKHEEAHSDSDIQN